jgi:hypothetical protein
VDAGAKVEGELPIVQQLAQQAAGNPAAIALFSTVHLQQAPELLQALADTIGKIEAGLAAAHAAGAQEATAPAEPPADAAPQA